MRRAHSLLGVLALSLAALALVITGGSGPGGWLTSSPDESAPAAGGSPLSGGGPAGDLGSLSGDGLEAAPAIGSDEPAPLAPVAPDLAGPSTPDAADTTESPSDSPASAASDAKSFKLKVGESLPLTPEQKAELARKRREAAIAARRKNRAKLPGVADDEERLAQVEQETVSRDDVAAGETADLEGVFELEDEESPETTEGVTTAIEGRVLDGDHGAPVVGAKVALFSSFYKPHLTYDRHLSELGGGVTDSEGRFRFAAVNVDALHYRGGQGLLLIIQHPAYANWSNAPPSPITEGTTNALGEIRLTPAGITLAGQIRNRDGSPLKDLLVTISPDNPVNVTKPQRQILLKSLPGGTTDGDGRYRIDGLMPGKVWISVHAGLDGVLFQEITVTASREDLNFTVRVGGAVTGRIIDRNGAPVASARIDGSGNTTHSNADGTFLLENLDSPGPFRINITHHAHYPRAVDDVRDGLAGLEVALDPLPIATLVVREGDTFAALTEIEVLYNAPAAVRATIPTSPYRQSADGTFPVTLYPKAVSIRVFKQGFKEQILPLTELAGGTSREVVLERAP